MKRIMALDVGEKRVGVAVSDPLGITAQPVSVLKRENFEKLMQILRELIDEFGVGRLVVGVPYNMRGEEGISAGKIMEFIELMKKNIDIEVDLMDERFSTAFSERAMLEADATRKKRRENIDKVAAAVILQGYLDKTEG
jgi:putative holliday junction resolvase